MALAIFGLGLAFFGLLVFCFISVLAVELLKLLIKLLLRFYRHLHTS
ncbi:hypothetical protein SAMN02910356_00142 [Selenomonas sp. GACV-9]|nr:hypothetical protein SAMN02910356_00142 [Selenomonas ruminantium]